MAVILGRALLGDDPALGFGEPSRAVLLFEPAEATVVVDATTGTTGELGVESLVRRGFDRFTPGVAVPVRLDGWTARGNQGRLELRDDAGRLWAYAPVRPRARWLATAARQGEVLVVYGAMVGVCAPRGVPCGQYGPAQRAAELRTARASGLVAAALVPWSWSPRRRPLTVHCGRTRSLS